MRVTKVRGLRVAFLLGSLAVVGAFPAADDRPARADDETDGVFGSTRIWTVSLHVSAEAWKQVQPAGDAFSAFSPPPDGLLPLAEPPAAH